MRTLFGLLALLLTFVGCSRTNDQISRYHEDGRAKPVVAIAPLIDTTSFDVPWSLSEELTSMVVQQISQSNDIFANAREETSFAENPFGSEMSWMKREFRSDEFVVFLELVEHDSVPVVRGRKPAHYSPQEVSTNLNMGIRLRVVDLRGPAPKIVLQEMIRDSYYIPKTLLPTDYNIVSWGHEEYRRTPMGIAHTQLVQEVVQRLRDYILLAKSR